MAAASRLGTQITEVIAVAEKDRVPAACIGGAMYRFGAQ